MLLLFSLVFTLKYNVIHNEEHRDEIHSLLESDDEIIKINSFGSTLELKKSTANKIKKHPKVLCIEEDKEVKIATLDYFHPSRGLDNNFHPSRGLDNNFHPSKGADNNFHISKGADNNFHPSKGLDNNFHAKEQISSTHKTIPYYYNKDTSVEFRIQYDAPWGLSRISGHLNSYEYINEGGKDVLIYILDTGIDPNHPDFEGRASFLYNAVKGSPNIDEQGHGTHCAGIIGSKTYGVAKGCNLAGIKVLDKEGRGMISTLLEGIDFLIKDYLSRSNLVAAVVNMSIGGNRSIALNHAIKMASKFNIHFSTAAGNENKDACEFSPSSSDFSLTIGASNIFDEIAPFSNEGNCVDVYAPGVSIKSLWLDNRYKELSGTSMATPHVTGMMAVYLGMADFTVEELKKRIKLDSKKVIGKSIFKTGKGFSSMESLYLRIKQRVN